MRRTPCLWGLFAAAYHASLTLKNHPPNNLVQHVLTLTLGRFTSFFGGWADLIGSKPLFGRLHSNLMRLSWIFSVCHGIALTRFGFDKLPFVMLVVVVTCCVNSPMAIAAKVESGGVYENSIKQSMLEILNDHPSVREAASSLKASEYIAQGAVWQFFPTPSFTSQKISASATNPVYGYGYGDPRVSTISISQPLWTGGRLYSGFRKSQAGVRADEANFKAVSQTIALNFIQSYGDWLNAQLKIRALTKSLATHQKLIALITRRIEGGISASSDLTLADGRMNTVTSALDQANAQSSSALVRLEQLFGHPVDVVRLRGVNTTLELGMGNNVEMVERALIVNPDILKASADISIAESEIGIQRSNYSPALSVQASRQYGNFGYANQPPQNTIGLVLATQFGAGLSSYTQVEQAKSRYEAAKSKVEAVKRLVAEQVMADVTNLKSAEMRLVSLQKAYLSSEQVALSWDRQFLAGRKSWLELMNAAQELAQAELSVADTTATLFILKWRLAITTQGLDALLSPEQEKAGAQTRIL